MKAEDRRPRMPGSPPAPGLVRHLVAIMGWALLAVLPQAVMAKPPPNLIFIMGDDHTSQTWGCYGGRLSDHLRTPHIDRLATEGALMRNAFCENAICVPSRATILTGQYSHRHGVKTLRDSLDPKTDHVAKRLRQAGYQTALVGKWHLKKPPAGFDYWNIIRGQGRYREPIMHEMDLDKPEVQKGAFSTDVFTDVALDWLARRDPEKPFCLMLHFKATHESWQYPPRYKSLYEGLTLPEPATLHGPTGPVDSRVPGWPLEILTKRMKSKSIYGDGTRLVTGKDPRQARSATYQKFIKDFLRCARAIDDNIGRVLKWLDETGHARDTVVIYTSDQGYFLGEHNYFDKRFMLEESLRMPMVVRYPPEIGKGTVVKDIILNVDLAPTLLDYAGVEAPATMQGRSFRAHLASNSPREWRQAMYYRYHTDSPQRPAHYGIRTHRYKLIYYDGLTRKPKEDRWEFYDLEQDPQETRNRYVEARDDSSTPNLIPSLKKRLRDLQQSLGDKP